jgi:tRNA modification GTPase
MSDFQLNDTIVALATATGKSGICVIRLSGPDAISIASKLLPDPSRLYVALPNSGFHSSFSSESGEELDDGILNVYRTPYSFTGEDVVEIAGHGSPAIAELLITELALHGARLAEPGEFSRRAFYNGKLELKDLEIITSRVAAADVGSLRGSAKSINDKFERLELLYQALIKLLAEVNAEIDFGDSDHIHIDGLTDRIRESEIAVGELLSAARASAVNSGVFTVALTGAPNVGKSSLFNALVSYKRSIVSELPGTTRDYLEAFIELDGHRIKLMDTAGDRLSNEYIEQEGIQLGKLAAIEADLTFLVTSPYSRDTEVSNGVVLLHNKSDLDGYINQISVSALTGEGMGLLRSRIMESAKAMDVEMSKPALSISERAQLLSVQSHLQAISRNPPEDPGLLADDLRQTIDTLAPLLGVNISEDALNHIFASMCIGK